MLEDLKIKVCKANKQLFESGLAIFTWGNVSAIDPDKKIIAIKPSGIEYNLLKPDDIVLVDLNEQIIEGERRPSSDTPSHIELYRNFNGIKSIVHTHSSFAASFAQAKMPIQCLGTTHADEFYGEIPITRELNNEEIKNNYEKNTGRLIVETFKKKNINHLDICACLVALHGPFVWGITIEKAIYNSIVLEHIAKINLETLKLNPSLQQISNVLLDKHYLRKHGKNAYYGQNI